MNNKGTIGNYIIYGLVIFVLIWGVVGSFYFGIKELLGAFGHLVNWSWASQFFVESKGVGMHIFAGLFLLALGLFLGWMGLKFLTWVRDDSKKRKARQYKRRNYR